MVKFLKILAIPLYPIGLSLVLMIVSVVSFSMDKRKAGIITIIAAVCVLYVFSMPLGSHILVRSLERHYYPPETYPHVPAIVLLGGSEIPRLPPRRYDEVNYAGDRILHAARLFKQAYSSRIVCTGGKGEIFRNSGGPESSASFRLLTGVLGIDSSAIIEEQNARTTRENGKYVAALFDSLEMEKEIILVTSAFHMKRSVAVFEKHGFKVYPAPTDYIANEQFQFKFMNFLPRAEALLHSSLIIHELYGLIGYRVFGWL